MNLQKIITAEKEAKEFLKRCNGLRECTKNDACFFYGSKKTASLKRQSMELSNALVDLRKSS